MWEKDSARAVGLEVVDPRIEGVNDPEFYSQASHSPRQNFSETFPVASRNVSLHPRVTKITTLGLVEAEIGVLNEGRGSDYT